MAIKFTYNGFSMLSDSFCISLDRAGRAHVEANYDIDKLNDRLVEIYQGLL